MSRPLISVILPAFDGERYIAEAIDSLVRQTYPNLEIIVVDDGSRDRTADIVAGFGDRVRFFRQPHGGPGVARNFGRAQARGTLIGFMDHDDIAHLEKFERQAVCLEDNPQADASLIYIQNFWIEELAAERQRLAGHPMTEPVLARTLTSMLARAEVFERVGPLDTSYRTGEDTDWFIRAEEAGIVFAPVEDILLYRRIHRTNLTRREAAVNRDELALMVKRSLDRRRQRQLPGNTAG